MSKLVDYALEYIGKKELEWYCMEIETKEIDLKALKQHFYQLNKMVWLI